MSSCKFSQKIIPDLVPQASALPNNEIAVCHRVREVRELLRFSQPAFAQEITISRVRLASYEYARAPLRYLIGAKMCERFNVSQRWLATGHLPRFFWVPAPPEIEARIPDRELFSAAYKQHLEEPIVARLMDCAGALGCTVSQLESLAHSYAEVSGAGNTLGAAVANVVARYIQRRAKNIPSDKASLFYSAVVETVETFFKTHLTP